MEKVVIALRKKGKSYNEIANQLGLKRDRVRYICVKHGYGGILGEKKGLDEPLEKREEKFAKKFNDKYKGQFKYHSGFVHVDKTFKCQCLECGHIEERNAQLIRRQHRKSIRCTNCHEATMKVKNMRETMQQDLDDEYKAIVSKASSQATIETRRAIEKVLREMNTKEYECLECGTNFVDTRIRKYCSNECAGRYSSRVKDLRRRKRLKENGEIDYSVTLSKLIQRDKGKCVLCGEKVDEDDFIITDEGHHIAGDDYPSIDHILPVSKGGTHTWDNVQLAHRGCNSKKKDDVVYQEEGQLVLAL